MCCLVPGSNNIPSQYISVRLTCLHSNKSQSIIGLPFFTIDDLSSRFTQIGFPYSVLDFMVMRIGKSANLGTYLLRYFSAAVELCIHLIQFKHEPTTSEPTSALANSRFSLCFSDLKFWSNCIEKEFAGTSAPLHKKESISSLIAELGIPSAVIRRDSDQNGDYTTRTKHQKDNTDLFHPRTNLVKPSEASIPQYIGSRSKRPIKINVSSWTRLVADYETDSSSEKEGSEPLVPRRNAESPSHDSTSISLPQNSIFDNESNRQEAFSSTLPTSRATGKLKAESQFGNFINAGLNTQQDSDTKSLPKAAGLGATGLVVNPDESLSNYSTSVPYPSSTDTIYSIDSTPEGLEYIHLFANRLIEDLKEASGLSNVFDIPSSFIDDTVGAFTWLLHLESTNDFQWEASVVLNRKKQ